jgi:MFS family permease
MAVYALFVVGSNYFAPIMCGFIAEYQGWQWVFYWPAIFLGCSFIFLFLFMEETTYDRNLTPGVSNETEDPPTILDTKVPFSEPPQENGTENAKTSTLESYPRKTYIQKLTLFHPAKKNTVLYRVKEELMLIGWPIVFYSGYFC